MHLTVSAKVLQLRHRDRCCDFYFLVSPLRSKRMQPESISIWYSVLAIHAVIFLQGLFNLDCNVFADADDGNCFSSPNQAPAFDDLILAMHTTHSA